MEIELLAGLILISGTLAILIIVRLTRGPDALRRLKREMV